MEPGEAMGIGRVLFFVVWAIVLVIPFWRISTKAGFSGWLSLLMVIPLVNLVYVYFLAFARWPSLERRAPAPPSGEAG